MSDHSKDICQALIDHLITQLTPKDGEIIDRDSDLYSLSGVDSLFMAGLYLHIEEAYSLDLEEIGADFGELNTPAQFARLIVQNSP